MRSSISSSDRRFIVALALWIVGLSAAANLVAGYGLGHWDWLSRRMQMPKFEVAANLQDYVRNWRRCPVVVLGSSVVGGLPPAGWEKPGVCSITLVGQGSLLGLDVMAQSPAAPKILFVESNFGFRDTVPDVVAATSDPVRRVIHDWLPLSTAQANWINALGKSQFGEAHGLDRPTESWEAWRESRKAYADIYVKMYGNPVGDWGRQHLEENLQHTRTLVAELERRGTKFIFFEAPLDPRLTELPVIALWAEKMHKAFADHDWVTDAPEKYYLTDGMHFMSGSGKDFFDLLMSHVPEAATISAG